MSCIFLKEDIEKLLMNKYVVVMGGSIQRSVYKDLVRLLQGSIYLKDKELRLKGEETILGDKLVFKSQAINGPQYREVREYMTDHHFLKFIFLTRCYNSYVETLLKEFDEAETALKPDVIIINSCLWDLTSYGGKGRNDASAIDEYKENLEKMFTKFKEVLPDCLCIWNTNPPISKHCKGGVFVPGTENLKSCMGLHLLEANSYSQKLAIKHGFDVLDLYYYLLHHVHRRAEDGIHWDMTAHRRITNLILTHISEAWDKELPNHLNTASVQKDCKTTKKAEEILKKIRQPFETITEGMERESADELQEQSNDDDDFHTKFMRGEHITNQMNKNAQNAVDINSNFHIDASVEPFPHPKGSMKGPRNKGQKKSRPTRRPGRFPRGTGPRPSPPAASSSSPVFQNANEVFNYRSNHNFCLENRGEFQSHGWVEVNFRGNTPVEHVHHYRDNTIMEHTSHLNNIPHEHIVRVNMPRPVEHYQNYHHTEMYAENCRNESELRNPYAEDRYISNTAANYYNPSPRLVAPSPEERWSPYHQNLHRGKMTSVVRPPGFRYMPYVRHLHPAW